MEQIIAILADCQKTNSGEWTYWRDTNYCLAHVYDCPESEVKHITEGMLSFEIDADIREGAKRLGCFTRLLNNSIYKGGLN